MRAIILAAGKGSRLNGLIGDQPKCLIRVGSLTLIERQILSLKIAGIHDIVVVVGHGAEQVRAVCGSDVSFIENTIYDRTNSLFSLWLTRHLIPDGFLVMNGDVLFHQRLLGELLDGIDEDALLVDYRDETSAPFGDEEMKVTLRNGRIVDISKQIEPPQAHGENVGIAKFGAEGARLLSKHMDKLIEAGAERDWAPRAFRELAFERRLIAVSTRGYPWIEIDFPEDYERAVGENLPRLSQF